MKEIKKATLLKGIFVGILVGIAIIVPGISGVAFLMCFGLYEEVLNSLSCLFKEFRKSICFLFPIIIGCFFGIFLGVCFLKVVYINEPFLLMCCLCGLMISNLSYFKEKVKISYLKKKCVVFLISIFIPVLFCFLSNYKVFVVSVEKSFFNYVVLFIIGIILSFTQMIPGLSATVFLMNIGLFDFLLSNLKFSSFINNFDIVFIYGVILIGLIVGMVVFSKVVSFCFLKHDKMMNLISFGLSIGSMVLMFFNQNMLSAYIKMSKDKINCLFEIVLGICFFVSCLLLSNCLKKVSKMN